jgi:hypothetical protein
MRGKSARVGSGFVAESPTSPFPPFQLPIKRRFLVETKLQLFSVSSRSNMGFIRRQRITSLSIALCSRIQQCSRKKLLELSSQLEPREDSLHMRLCLG